MSRLNEWNESLEQTVNRSANQNGLLVYSMVAGEEIQIGLSGHIAENVSAVESRVIRARALGLPNGALEILEDTSEEDSLSNRTVCLGSIGFSLMGIEFTTGGLLRGFIGKEQAAIVDMNAEHFIGAKEPTLLLSQYITLDLEGQKIF